MKQKKSIWQAAFLHVNFWAGWRSWVVWSACISALLLLGTFRSATDAEFTLASFSLLPVLVVAWLGGRNHGLLIASIAAVMWGVSDILSDRQFSALWIPWANAITYFMTYGLLVVLADRVRKQFQKEHEHATHDVLTGLLNRRAFLEIGASEVARSKRYEHPMCVIFLDLDDFKQLNDSKGHDAGDAALRTTGKALLNALRTNDYVARLGGDEFAVLLPETGYDESVETGRKILASVNSTLRSFPPVGASIGIAWFGEVDRAFPEMLKAADELMYQVKESGKHNMRSMRFAAINKSGASN